MHDDHCTGEGVGTRQWRGSSHAIAGSAAQPHSGHSAACLIEPLGPIPVGNRVGRSSPSLQIRGEPVRLDDHRRRELVQRLADDHPPTIA